MRTAALVPVMRVNAVSDPEKKADKSSKFLGLRFRKPKP